MGFVGKCWDNSEWELCEHIEDDIFQWGPFDILAKWQLLLLLTSSWGVDWRGEERVEWDE